MAATPPRKRGRPPFTRQDHIVRHAHRYLRLWVWVRHVQATAYAAGVKSPRLFALRFVAKDEGMALSTLKNLLKKGLKGVPADVRAPIERSIANIGSLRVTYRLYAEAKANAPALHAAQEKERVQAERNLEDPSPFGRALKQVVAKNHTTTAWGEFKQMHEFDLLQWLQNGRPENMPDEVRALLKYL